MPEGSTVSSGQRFAADLRSLRERSGTSLEEMHEATKIPRNLLSSFEETGLFENPMFNRVYLRSFVRMYAEIIGLEETPALEALERALTGTYDGDLVGASPGGGSPESKAAAPVAAAAEGEGPAEPPSRREGEEASTPETEAVEPEAPKGPATSAPSSAAASEANKPSWMTASPPPTAGGTPRSRSVGASAGGAGAWMPWVLGLAALIVVAGAVWFFAFRSDGEEAAVSAAPPPDTTAQQAPEPEPPPPPVELGETIAVRVLPDGDKVQGLRATLDDDVRRPYWAELDSTLLFSMSDQVIFEDAVDGPPGQLENIAIEIDGVPYPTTYRDAEDRIVITRDTARVHLQRSRAN